MFVWIVITGGIYSFIASMGIGSNDAANAFASSIGSGALTLKQAAGLAIIFETGGAILMGNHVDDTIRKGIADYKCFENEPEVLMYGCMYVILAVAIWLFTASYLEMPVSTTHSCVGGMVGMTIALAGSNCVIWYKEVDTFPYIGGISGIVLSWFISPIFSGLISAFSFGISRTLVLRHSYDSNRINYIFPILIGITLTINSFFIIYKGAKGVGSNNLSTEYIILISFSVGIGGSLLIIPFIPKIRKIVNKKFQKIQTNTVRSNNFELINYSQNNIQNYFQNNIQNNSQNNIQNNIQNNQSKLNINSESQLQIVTNLHNNAEKFDPRIEEFFKYLQIFTAICDSFSHGANDVANGVGPFAAIYLIYRENGNISKKVDMENDGYWILSIGGVGIAIGLLVYGKKIIYAIGTKLCKITPSRGTCIELSSALIIIIGSRLKIPLSTTHCQVGATIGVGILENKSLCKPIEGINCYILAKTAFGWIITCVIVGVIAGILSAQGIYGPSKFELCRNVTV